MSARLAADVESANAKERPSLLLALGNTALRENVATIAHYAKDEDADVREATAHALRDIDTPVGRETLLEMLGDDSRDVAHAAILSYDRRPLGAEDMATLASQVARGGVNPTTDVALLSVVQAHTEDRDPAEQILLELLKHVHGDGEQEAKIRLLLRRVRGEG